MAPVQGTGEATTAAFHLLGPSQQILAHPNSGQHIPGCGPSTALLHSWQFSSTQPNKPCGTQRGNGRYITITNTSSLPLGNALDSGSFLCSTTILKTSLLQKIKIIELKYPYQILGLNLVAILRFYKVFTTIFLARQKNRQQP